MPILTVAGSGLGYAGQAAAQVTPVIQQGNQQLLRAKQLELQAARDASNVTLRNKLYEQREAAARVKLQDEERERGRKALASLQKGLARSLEIARELGVGTGMDDARGLGVELERLDPDMAAQMDRVYPLPASETDPSYPIAFNARAKALMAARQADGLQVKSQVLSEMEVEAERSGYTPEELAGLEAAFEGDTPSEFLEKAEGVRKAARSRIRRRQELEYVQAEVKKLEPEIMKLLAQYEPDEEAAELYESIVSGQSKRPRRDLAILRVKAAGDGSVLDEIQADAFALGQASVPRPAVDPSPMVDPQGPGPEPSPSDPAGDVPLSETPGIKKALGLEHKDRPFDPMPGILEQMKADGVPLDPDSEESKAEFIRRYTEAHGSLQWFGREEEPRDPVAEAGRQALLRALPGGGQ